MSSKWGRFAPQAKRSIGLPNYKTMGIPPGSWVQRAEYVINGLESCWGVLRIRGQLTRWLTNG